MTVQGWFIAIQFRAYIVFNSHAKYFITHLFVLTLVFENWLLT